MSGFELGDGNGVSRDQGAIKGAVMQNSRGESEVN